MDDFFGQALLDYYLHTLEAPLILHTSYGPSETLPLERFFHDEDAFSDLDFFALDQARGSILDIGAAAGRHALFLQQQGLNVTVLDISPSCGKIMEESGLKKIIIDDAFHYAEKKYDTLLMLMNGIGIAGDIDGLSQLFHHLKTIITPRGQLLLDSTDISYMYDHAEKPTDRYFGELTFRYEYKNKLGKPFKWLYLDQKKLIDVAQKTGWTCQIIFEDESDAYLARLQTR